MCSYGAFESGIRTHERMLLDSSVGEQEMSDAMFPEALKLMDKSAALAIALK